MTVDEIAASLPNGFHDAELVTVEINYAKRTARIILDLWVGDIDEELEKYRPAEFKLSGLMYWASEPPDPNYPFQEAGALKIDVGAMDALP